MQRVNDVTKTWDIQAVSLLNVVRL